MNSMSQRVFLALLVAALSVSGGSIRYKDTTGLSVHFWMLNDAQAGELQDLIFTDSFESGDTTAWSAVVP